MEAGSSRNGWQIQCLVPDDLFRATHENGKRFRIPVATVELVGNFRRKQADIAAQTPATDLRSQWS
jgi:hypothetical protein